MRRLLHIIRNTTKEAGARNGEVIAKVIERLGTSAPSLPPPSPPSLLSRPIIQDCRCLFCRMHRLYTQLKHDRKVRNKDSYRLTVDLEYLDRNIILLGHYKHILESSDRVSCKHVHDVKSYWGKKFQILTQAIKYEDEEASSLIKTLLTEYDKLIESAPQTMRLTSRTASKIITDTSTGIYYNI